MALFRSKVPDIGVCLSITNFKLLDSVISMDLSSSNLSAHIKDGLSQSSYERVSKEIRVLYAFCFEQVYSEDYDVNTGSVHYSYGGHDERKEHLLAENSHVSEEFSSVGQQLFNDIAGLSIGQAGLRGFFNSAFIWARANELQELQLLTEAYTQYWRLLDLVDKRAQLSQSDSSTLLAKYKMPQTQSNIFAVRVLHKMDMLEEGKTSNIESLSLLDSLRHPHAHQANVRTDYYMEEETHLDAEMHNIFISDIAKLFVIWELGLRDYYLKPRANIYQLAKR